MKALVAKNDANKLEKFALIKDYVLDGNKLMGLQVHVAKRLMTLEDGMTTIPIYVTAIRDVHDKNIAAKDLRFFSMRNLILKMP